MEGNANPPTPQAVAVPLTNLADIVSQLQRLNSRLEALGVRFEALIKLLTDEAVVYKQDRLHFMEDFVDLAKDVKQIAAAPKVTGLGASHGPPTPNQSN